jgi:acyl dehydratase
MLVNYGLERVRFPAPVPVGSRLRGHAELVSVTEVTGGHQAVIRMTVELEGGAKPACVAEHVVRLLS